MKILYNHKNYINCHAELVSASYQYSMQDRSRNKFWITVKMLLIFLCFLIYNCAEGATVPPQNPPIPSPIQPQPVSFENCNKFFKINSQKLFYLALAGVNANRFRIDEIQSKSGYVLFSVAQRQFLARVINIDAQNSVLKITPCNNVYYFPVGIVQNMFKYIELNINIPVETLSIL